MTRYEEARYNFKMLLKMYGYNISGKEHYCRADEFADLIMQFLMNQFGFIKKLEEEDPHNPKKHYEFQLPKNKYPKITLDLDIMAYWGIINKKKIEYYNNTDFIINFVNKYIPTK